MFTKKPKPFSKRYDELKELNAKNIAEVLKGKENARLSTQGKKHFVFPFLEEKGFDTWEKIYNEVVLIADKKSDQPKEVRDLLVTVYHAVTKTV